MHVFEMETFNDQLYIGTGSFKIGYGVWKADRAVRPYHITPIVTGGAGRGPLMTGVIAMHPFKGCLYVSAVSWYSTNDIPTTEMIRIARNGRWEVVVGRPRMVNDGIYRYPISGLMDGFDNIFMPHIWRIGARRRPLRRHAGLELPAAEQQDLAPGRPVPISSPDCSARCWPASSASTSGRRATGPTGSR